MARSLRIILGLAACLISAQAFAAAALVTFSGFGSDTIIGDEFTGNGLAIGTSSGLKFTSSGDHFHIGSGLGGVPSNGTSILLAI